MLKPRISVELLSYVWNDKTRRRAPCDDATVGGGDENTAIRNAGIKRLDPPITHKTLKREGLRPSSDSFEDDACYHGVNSTSIFELTRVAPGAAELFEQYLAC